MTPLPPTPPRRILAVLLAALFTVVALFVWFSLPLHDTPIPLTADALASHATRAPLALSFTPLATRPYDPTIFTQGLEYQASPTLHNKAFVSSGGYGASWVGVVDTSSGTVLKKTPLPSWWFAEGLTLTPNNELVVLSWQENVAAFFDPVTLSPLRRVPFDREGWGVCTLADGRLITSDGTDTLAFRTPDTLIPTGTLPVRRGGEPLDGLNELACHNDLVWANVFPTPLVAAIDPRSGVVVGTLDLTSLTNRPGQRDVPNGITPIPGTTDEFLVTGKLWPESFHIRVAAHS